MSSLPSSERIMAATDAIGLDIEATRKIESAFIAVWARRSWNPTVSSDAILPFRAISITAPGMRLLSTSIFICWRRRPRRWEEMPTSSGRLADGSDCASAAAQSRTSISPADDLRIVGILISLYPTAFVGQVGNLPPIGNRRTEVSNNFHAVGEGRLNNQRQVATLPYNIRMPKMFLADLFAFPVFAQTPTIDQSINMKSCST